MKANLYSFFSIFILCLLLSLLLEFFFDLDAGWRSGIAGGVSVLLSPRFKVIRTQSGEQIQITLFIRRKPWTLK